MGKKEDRKEGGQKNRKKNTHPEASPCRKVPVVPLDAGGWLDAATGARKIENKKKGGGFQLTGRDRRARGQRKTHRHAGAIPVFGAA